MTIEVKELNNLLMEKFPALKFSINEHEEGGHILFGSFPTLAFTIGVPGQVDGFIISLNADPAFIGAVVTEAVRAYPELEALGAFSERMDGGPIVLGPEAYTLREEHILMQSLMIAKQRGVDTEEGSKLFVPEEKKILVPGV